MNRYVLVRGKPGILVPRPESSMGPDGPERTGRAFGKRKLTDVELAKKLGCDSVEAFEKKFGRRLPTLEQIELKDRYEDIDEVAPLEWVQKAMAAGELHKVAGPVVATGVDDARARLGARSADFPLKAEETKADKPRKGGS
jgi:hypothetical protein